MDSDISELLKSFRTQNPTVIRYVNSVEADRAIQIMNDIKEKKILLIPTNAEHLKISDMFGYLFQRYERTKNVKPFPEYIAKRIIDAYNFALSYGMVKSSNDENELKNIEIARLTKELEQARKDLEEIEDKNIPTFKTDIEEID